MPETADRSQTSLFWPEHLGNQVKVKADFHTEYRTVFRYMRPEKTGKDMESKNRPKSHRKYQKFKENLEKSWNLPPGPKLKIFKINIKFLENGLQCIPPHIP
jgi:hypothetical protein